MRSLGVTVCGLALAVPALLWAAEDTKGPDTANYGLKGPVHTVMSTVEALAPDPRKQPFMTFFVQCGNCTFDRRGYFQSRAAISQDGLQQSHSEIEVDALGWPTAEREYSPDGKLSSESRYQNGPYGPVNYESWVGGGLSMRSETVYDEHGRPISSRTWDEHGALLVETSTRWGDGDQVLEAVIRFPQSRDEDVETSEYNSKGERTLLERRHNGELQMRASFEDGKIASWFMKPRAGFGIGFPVRESPELTVYQSSDPETGGLTRTEYVHPAGRPNLESEIRHYDTNGCLVEKLTFEYEWDIAGNWTRRTACVWDINAGTSIAVQRITRTIVYY